MAVPSHKTEEKNVGRQTGAREWFEKRIMAETFSGAQRRVAIIGVTGAGLVGMNAAALVGKKT